MARWRDYYVVNFKAQWVKDVIKEVQTRGGGKSTCFVEYCGGVGRLCCDEFPACGGGGRNIT